MNLNSERLFLKELDWDELGNIHRLNSHEEVDRYNTLGIPGNIEVTRELIRKVVEEKGADERSQYAWSIYIVGADIFLGEIGMKLSVKRFKMAEIYYNLIPDRWGRGFATEAARVVFNFGFNELGLHRIVAGVAVGNHGSIRVLEKLGMKREGLGRKILPIRGEWKDNFTYSILEEEFRFKK